MAKDISDVVKQCKILLLDIEGTTTSISFVKDKLFPYAEENVKSFLEAKWETDDVKQVVEALRKLALEDQEKNLDGLVKIPGEDATKEDQIEGLVNNVKWQMTSDRKAGPLKQLQGLIWQQGYENGDIKGHVYDDVSPALEQWRSTGQKVYIYSSGSVQAQKLLFGQSQAGDMLKLIDGHFDTAVGAKQEADSYKKIVAEIGCKPDEILFLTDIVKEAEAAVAAGLHAALVTREGNSPLPQEATTTYPLVSSFTQLATAKKRKTDDQDEQPAKVPKTDAVKTSPSETSAKTENKKTDKMEVENGSAPENSKTEETITAKPVEETVTKEIVETKIEEVSESAPIDVPMVNVEPVVIEAVEEKSSEPEESAAEANKEAKDDKKPAPTEESPSVVITEIEEVTDDKKNLEDVTDNIEDIEPVVEEPQNVEAEMEDLKNVGESLEKECDEILSKVQDVTNLDNIAVKPLLNPISEEMETDNLDTNDIVDSILDSDLEMEMKQCNDIDESTVTEMEEEAKPETENGVTEEVTSQTTDTVENKVQEEEPKPKEAESTTDAKPDVNEDVKEPEKEAVEAEKPVESESKVESQLNGNATNGGGDAPVVNGDTKDEVNSRLSENGKEVVNGANGDSNGKEEGQGDAKEADVPEIKVKTVAPAERIDPIEQPTEA